MSQKHRAASGGGPADIQRLIERRAWKDAFKQAKSLFQRENTPENRRLVEKTYLFRIQDLERGGMPTAAAEVAGHFLEFGVTDQDVLQQLVLLLPRVGMADRAAALGGRLNSPETAAALEVKLVDLAVVHPGRLPASRTDLRQQAERIRAALARLQHDDSPDALEAMRDIPRNSPWADWRIFVRGVAAHYRGDAAQANSNWDHLDQDRSAWRIAEVLRKAGRQDPQADLSRLEAAVFGIPILQGLSRLRGLVHGTESKAPDWKQALPLAGALSQGLRRVDPRLAVRLTSLLIVPLMDDLNEESSYARVERTVQDFARAMEPLPIDPHWNRLWARLWDNHPIGVPGSVTYWREYIDDLKDLALLKPQDRPRAQAAVWRHIAEQFGRLAGLGPSEEFEDCEPPETREVQDDLRREVEKAVNESLRLDPSQRPTHWLRVALYDTWDKPEQATAAAREMLGRFPDDELVLSWLMGHYVGRDEPELALPYYERMRALRPLDMALQEAQALTWLGAARKRAVGRKFAEAREAFAQAEAVCPRLAGDPRMLVRQAVLERKAGNEEVAESLEKELRGCLGEPAALLATLIEAERYKLPAAQVRGLKKSLKAALARATRPAAAAQMAGILLFYSNHRIDLENGETLEKQVIDYIRRSSHKGRYQEHEAEKAGLFLHFAGTGSRWISNLLFTWRRAYPRNPVLQGLDALASVERGMSGHFERVRQELLQAIQGIESRGAIEHLSLLLELKEALTEVGQRENSSNSFKFFLDSLDREDEEDWEREPDDVDEPENAPGPRRSGRPAPNRR